MGVVHSCYCCCAHASTAVAQHHPMDNRAVLRNSAVMVYNCLGVSLPILCLTAVVVMLPCMHACVDVLQVLLNDIDLGFLRLDGSTPVRERQALMDQFNSNDNIPIFLLSTKAGGLGINLTAGGWETVLRGLDLIAFVPCDCFVLVPWSKI